MGILDFILILFVAYVIKSYRDVINDHNKRKPMQTITEIRSHHWLIRMGMREHAENFNDFGLRRAVTRRKSRSQ